MTDQISTNDTTKVSNIGTNGSGNGLLGKLMLPGYTDAGASTAFYPVAEEHESDALTEVCDNRSNNKIKQKFNGQNSNPSYKSSISAHADVSVEQTLQDDRTTDGKFQHTGFFPSTNPTSIGGIGGSNGTRQGQQHQEPQQPQQQLENLPSENVPSPDSPPVVARRQMPAPSVAGTSTIPETGGRFALSSLAYPTSTDIDNNSLENDTRPLTSEALGSHLLESAKNKLESGRDCDNNVQLHRRLQLRSGTVKDTNSEERDIEGRANDRSPSSPKSDAQHSSFGSDVMSEVNSTASEMGTVVQLDSSRMAEINAMAALIEASPTFQYEDEVSDYKQESVELKLGLSLPILESGPQEDTSENVSSTPLASDLLQQKQSTSATAVGLDETKYGIGANAMMSAAIRRIGSGIGNSAKKQTLSAPPTPGTPGIPAPPRVEDLLKSTLSPHSDLKTNPPPSFALRSPGSSARHSLSEGRLLAPRYAKHEKQLGQGIHRTTHTSKITTGAVSGGTSSKFPISQILPGPLRFAQKCFSFDSTLEEYSETGTSTIKQQELPATKSTSFRTLRQSMSWDISGPSFRGERKPSRLSLAHADEFNAAHSTARPGLFRDNHGETQKQRSRLRDQFAPSRMNAVELQTPQRIELEREDALDILTCLVERGVALHGWDNSSDPRNGKETLRESSDVRGSQDAFSDSQLSKNGSGDGIQNVEGTVCQSDVSDSNLNNVVEELRHVSKAHESSDGVEGQGHATRMAAIDELLRSHAYALEMKRAAISASAWLRSIGRSETSVDPDTEDEREPRVQGDTTRGQSSSEDDREDITTCSDKVELLSLRALLHNAQMEAKEKADAAKKLDEELSKCRAEIGRLKSASRAKTMISSPNVSILDENDNESASSAIAESLEREQVAPSPIRKEGSDRCDDSKDLTTNSIEDSLFHGLSYADGKDRINEADRLDLLVMKSALDEANTTIRQLHDELAKDKTAAVDAPTVEFPDVFKGRDVAEDNRMVNVRMLDGENFVTEWDDLTPPLPPPPDHGLRSPIVSTVLEQWTTDRSLHDSLLAWIERVMAGNELESVPPLTISSLDHQVRDGFTMHVLPLILRRADIHVAVQTRAHRRTTYDLAVSVTPNYEQRAYLRDDLGMLETQGSGDIVDDWSNNLRSEFERGSTTHSAVTAHITNAGRQSPTNYRNLPNGDGAMGHLTHSGHLSGSTNEINASLHQQQGIMGALGGALGGLLSRRKHSAASPARYYGESGSRNMHPSLRAQLDLTSSPVPSYSQEEDQPYHRVVSAPPGRIGVTFVEFRGHAVVSDVAPNSPLSGWVFPSDILIAIDEVPVSGMRVRDIIKVLTNRKSRQRALRVISSHAMNEFTLNSVERLDMNDGPS